MISRQLFSAAFALLLLGSHSAFALDWEIERNFRYFLYPSDVAAQRVARDIYLATHGGAAPTPEQSELQINGADFWTTKLAAAGDLRKRWPVGWPRDENATVYDLVKQLREAEGRSAPVGPEELSRRGWASLLARGPSQTERTGATDTCWNPVRRLHDHCRQWGEYVRPAGWIVRVFDPDASAGQTCQWTLDGAVFAEATASFTSQTRAALGQRAKPTESADCREIRIVVPSAPPDAADPRNTPVRGTAQVERSGAGATVEVAVDPSDRLIVGFGDSFTSGEGNPERPARFNGKTWSVVASLPGTPRALQSAGAADLPARDPDSIASNDTRAQWTDRWCHRSVYSWQIRAGLDLALADPHRSVTILHYGCSGAAILEGLLYAWNGVEYDPAVDRGVIGSRAEVGLAYQELCANFEPTNNAKLDPPTDAQESAPGFYAAALKNARAYVARCSRSKPNVFRRTADALLLDIGINDVEFSNWVSGLILDDGVLAVSHGFVPCVANGAPCDSATREKFDRLKKRFDLLSDVLTSYLLPEFGIAPDHVVAAIYPRELSGCGGDAGDRLSGNVGLTVATQPPPLLFPRINPQACQNAGLGYALGGHGGVIAALRDADGVRKVENARLLLNTALGSFAASLASGGAQPLLLTSFDSAEFRGRGFCATADAASRPPGGQACFTKDELVDSREIPCAPGIPPSNPESTHIPRPATDLSDCPHTGDTSGFHPFPPDRYEPYRHRERLFRTMNDVYMTINQRPPYDIDAAWGLLDLANRAAGGAFHPTAEGHAIVAGYAASALCTKLGCGP